MVALCALVAHVRDKWKSRARARARAPKTPRNTLTNHDCRWLVVLATLCREAFRAARTVSLVALYSISLPCFVVVFVVGVRERARLCFAQTVDRSPFFLGSLCDFVFVFVLGARARAR